VSRQTIALVAAAGISALGLIVTVGASGLFAALVFWALIGVLIYGFGSGR
jgi:hypothetical protein